MLQIAGDIFILSCKPELREERHSHLSQLFIHYPPEELPPPPSLGTHQMRGRLTGRTPTRRFPTPTQRDEQEAGWDFLMVYGTCIGFHCQQEEGLAPVYVSQCLFCIESLYAFSIRKENVFSFKAQDRGLE